MNNEEQVLSKERLSRDLICEKALELIDEFGLDAFSMRTLANCLGVKASSLYHHFDSKDELMTAVAELLYRRLGRPPDGGDWADQVKGTFAQLYEFLGAHPSAAPLLVRDLASSPVAKKRANTLLRLVRRAGVEPEDSTQLLSNLVALLVGHTLLELWLAEETLFAVDPDGVTGVKSAASRKWVSRLFPPLGPDRLELDGVVAEGEQPVEGTRVPGDGPSPQSAFFAGLDALIGGFVPPAA